MEEQSEKTIAMEQPNGGNLLDYNEKHKMDSTVDEKRTRLSAGHHSSGYGSADYSDYSENTAEAAYNVPDATVDSYFANDRTDRPCLRKQASVDSISSSSSGSDSDSDADGQDDTYRVELRKVREMKAHSSHQPRLYSPESTISQDGKLVYTLKKSESTTSSGSYQVDGLARLDSTSSIDSDSSEYKIVKRKSTKLKINKSVIFIKIQTVKYTHENKKLIQHYKKNLRPDEKDVEGDTGLREGDLLLGVNGTRLENKKQKHVLKIFKKIKPEHSDGIIQIKLHYRRWEKKTVGEAERDYEVDYELKLVLEPIAPETPVDYADDFKGPHRGHSKRHNPRHKYRVSTEKSIERCSTLLPKGKIDNIKQLGEYTARVKTLSYGPDEFLIANKDSDNVTCRVPDKFNRSQEVFTIIEFQGIDKSAEPMSYFIYCVRIRSSCGKGNKFLTTHLGDGADSLSFQIISGFPLKRNSSVERLAQLLFSKYNSEDSKLAEITPPNDVDETCFIKREIGSQVLLESLLYRGYYISSKMDHELIRLTMVKKTCDDVIDGHDLDDVKFEFFAVSPNETTDNGVVERLVHRVANWVTSRARHRPQN